MSMICEMANDHVLYRLTASLTLLLLICLIESSYAKKVEELRNPIPGRNLIAVPKNGLNSSEIIGLDISSISLTIPTVPIYGQMILHLDCIYFLRI